MKRLLFLLTAALLVLTACGGNDDVKEDEKQEESKVELSEEKVSFQDFTVTVDDVEIQDGKLYLKIMYKNDSYPEETAFMAAGSLDVTQGEELLKETSGVEADPKGIYYYKVKTGSHMPIEFEYELENETDDIEINVVPKDWDQDSKEITVTIALQ